MRDVQNICHDLSGLGFTRDDYNEVEDVRRLPEGVDEFCCDPYGIHRVADSSP